MAGRRVKGRNKRVRIGWEEFKSRGEEQRLVRGKEGRIGTRKEEEGIKSR